MPGGNNFQHATYSRADPGERVRYLEFEPGAPADSQAWQDAMAQSGARLSQAGVRVLVFLHGTAAGVDLFGAQRLDEAGAKRGYSRGIPGMETLLALMRQGANGLPALPEAAPPFQNDESTKGLIDRHTGDAANFSGASVELVRHALNRDLSRPIVCVRTLWSCEGHHLGRLEAAVQVIAQLRALCSEQRLGAGDRVLVQAHGQAGLVMALASNLLAPGESSGRTRVLEVLKGYALQRQQPTAGMDELETVMASGNVFHGAALDVITFGTPIRYGWETSGVGTLLHVVNHRPMRADGKRWLAKMDLPQITMEMPIAWGGDYVQQLAVAGSDAVPASPAAQAANKALWELLEPYDGFERWLECARKCVRCPADGLCLLVDYKDGGGADPREHVFGHAAYTRSKALLFNTAEAVEMLYASQG
jgi:hypothetical protein